MRVEEEHVSNINEIRPNYSGFHRMKSIFSYEWDLHVH